MGTPCNSNEASVAAWTAEYKNQGIPSSFRKDPTRIVTEFVSWIKKENAERKTSADLGCGLGRNSFYLATQGFAVTAIDLLQDNADAVNEQAKLLDLPVQAFAQDVSDLWPIAPNSLDIAIDIFCYKHLANKQAQKNYRGELWKALKPNGFYLISLASIHDGFYGPLLTHAPLSHRKSDCRSLYGHFLVSLLYDRFN
ncbi:MAG: class I SAM-dependent methyltransferase [Anaplasmataceae bacterium]|nr:class I SAM-dependent methyltransferase [Anaplasmataceae bacterium]